MDRARPLQLFWITSGLTVVVGMFAWFLGGTSGVEQTAKAMLLPHWLIGDFLHWNRLRQCKSSLWLGGVLAVMGCGIFGLMQLSGRFAWPMLSVYFLGHVLKDLDLWLASETDRVSPALRARHPKCWIGGVVLVAFGVLSSGLVSDVTTVAAGQTLVWAASLALLGLAVGLGVARRSAWLLRELWVKYALFGACALALVAWFTTWHPANPALPYAVMIWHTMGWYVVSWWLLPRSASGQSIQPGRWSLAWLKQSPRHWLAFVSALNGLAGVGMWASQALPAWQWLGSVYQLQGLAGWWLTMHITWNWVPKQVGGVRLAVI